MFSFLLRRAVTITSPRTVVPSQLLASCAPRHVSLHSSSSGLARSLLGGPQQAFLGSSSRCAQRHSSSLAGVARAGMPRMERDSKGRAKGPLKGGKGRQALGGVIAIKNSWNNTIISVSGADYKQLTSVSAGSLGFKKSKRSSQFATEKTLSSAFQRARELGIRRVMLALSGPAISLRKPLFRQIREESGLRIMKLRMTDNVPHGGCRPRKSRRRRWKTRARKR